MAAGITEPDVPFICTVIATSFVFFQALDLFVARRISEWLMPGLRPQEAAKAKDWDSRIIGFIHAVIAIPLALQCVLSPEFDEDPVNASPKIWELTAGISAGYFAWDTLLCLFNISELGPAFMFHAVACLGTYLTCLFLRPGGMAWHAAGALLFEGSTPFLHLRYFLLKMEKSHTLAFKLSQIAFALAFFFCRIVWGWGWCFRMTIEEIWLRPTGALMWPPHAWMLTILPVGLNVLNVVWMIGIVYKVVQSFQGDDKKNEKKVE